MGEEDAFLEAICARLDDSLPRLVYADWLDEHGRGDEAAAWRATADRVPRQWVMPVNPWSWTNHESQSRTSEFLHRTLFDQLTALPPTHRLWRYYPTARAALLDLVRAWVAVEREKEAERAKPKPCERCRGLGGEVNPTGGFQEFSGPYPTWEKCYACSGSGKAVAANG